MEKLIKMLNQISMDCFVEHPDGMLYADFGYDEVGEIDELACELLITPDAQPNYGAIVELENHGYEVYPGEQDSFGWLTGVIAYPDERRLFVFG